MAMRICGSYRLRAAPHPGRDLPPPFPPARLLSPACPCVRRRSVRKVRRCLLLGESCLKPGRGCFDSAWCFLAAFHMQFHAIPLPRHAIANSEVSHARTKRASFLTTSPPRDQTDHARSAQLHIRLLEGENPSNSVSRGLFGRRPNRYFGLAPLDESAESNHSIIGLVGCCLGTSCLPPGTPSPCRSLSIASHHHPICKRKMNAWWTADTFFSWNIS
ncbi:hypothetical protein BC826DRAFT_988690 [Russula brevipes]|nr:hypothetical protein BC826DRAFT_988690 [Russula brevipes]